MTPLSWNINKTDAACFEAHLSLSCSKLSTAPKLLLLRRLSSPLWTCKLRCSVLACTKRKDVGCSASSWRKSCKRVLVARNKRIQRTLLQGVKDDNVKLKSG